MTRSILLGAVALLASLPAVAAPQTYSDVFASDRDALVNDGLTDIEPGAASSAMITANDVSARAAADFGVIRLGARSPGAAGHGLAIAKGSFRDTIKLSGSGPVPVSINLLASGVATNFLPGFGDWGYNFSFFLKGDFTDISKTSNGTSADVGAVSIPLTQTGSAFAGTPLDLFVYFEIETSGNSFSSWDLDFAHTAILSGLGLPAGTTVTSATLGLLPTYNGQFTYQAVIDELVDPPVDTPEPAALALFGLAFGALALARRR